MHEQGDIDFAIGQDAVGATWDVPIFDDAGEPVDLTGATVALRYQRDNQTTAAVVRVGSVIGLPAVPPGKARYTFVAGDTNVPGIYFARWEITKAGAVIVYPARRLMRFEVVAKS